MAVDQNVEQYLKRHCSNIQVSVAEAWANDDTYTYLDDRPTMEFEQLLNLVNERNAFMAGSRRLGYT